MAIFNYLGSYGGSDSTTYAEVVREYPNNTYRRYLRSSTKHRRVTIPFKNLSLTKRNAIETFFNARMSSVADYEFTIYVWPEATSVDLTGSSSTGKHTARFAEDQELVFRNEGSCTYSCELTFVLLN